MINPMNKRSFSIAISLFLLLVGNTAFGDNDHETARRLSEKGDILPLETILQRVQQHQTGRVLEVEFEEEQDQYIYEVEVLNSKGVVWELKLDARTGEILERKQED